MKSANERRVARPLAGDQVECNISRSLRRLPCNEAAVKLFGSGWAWLAAGKDGRLTIVLIGNADTQLKHGKQPVLTIDVWVHSYYMDYRNERAKYVKTFWKSANWDFAGKCYAAVVK